MKLPSFQFYPGDWMKDPNLRRCSAGARGVWMDMICLMFECQERGVLASGGVPWTNDDIASSLNGNSAENLRYLEELLSKGVAHRNEQGAVYCKRMVRDQEERARNNERQRRHRHSDEEDGDSHAGSNAPVTPLSHHSSSSSSSSPSSSTTTSKEKKKDSKPRDPRLDHPAIRSVLEIKGNYPTKHLWDRLIEVLGEEPDVGRLKECWVAWRTKNYSPQNLSWALEWYVNGIPGGENGTNKPTRYQTAAEQRSARFNSRLAVVADLQERSQQRTG